MSADAGTHVNSTTESCHLHSYKGNGWDRRALFLSLLIFAYLKRKALPGVNMSIEKLFSY